MTTPNLLRRFILTLLFPGLIALGAFAQSPRPNVLFIAIDDLRDDLGALGVDYAKTPNLDKLAADSRLFSRHYVQVPTCGASRCALLSGRYPSEPAQVRNNAIRDTYGDWGTRSMPAWFRKHGYTTYALGKISHYPGGLTGGAWNEPPEEMPGAWVRQWIPESPWKTSRDMMHAFANGVPRTPGVSPAMEAFDGPDSAYPDWWVARDAISTIEELSKSDHPWFFAVGFFKPHLPFAAPKRWHELHANSSIPVPPNTARPSDPSSWHPSNEFRKQYNHHNRDPETDPAYADQMRHAYAAAASYADAQLGRFLDKVRALNLLEDTIVVVWSDHGFLLGEHAIWGKHCLYEDALRSPLMIHVPGVDNPGTVSEAVVETVDIFPTLVELCGLPLPVDLDGRSLVPQIRNPHAPTAKPAHGFWHSGQRTVRTDRWRLIEHPATGDRTKPAYELFDLGTGRLELENVAAAHPDVVKRLAALLPPPLKTATQRE